MSEYPIPEIKKAGYIPEFPIEFAKNAPLFKDVANDHLDRSNTLRARRDKSKTHFSLSKSPKDTETKTFTEREGLNDLVAFLDKAEELTQDPTVKEKSVFNNSLETPEDIASIVRYLREDMSFIGEKELGEATAGMADQIWEYTKEEDNTAYIYFTDVGSPRYITLLILEELSKRSRETNRSVINFKVATDTNIMGDQISKIFASGKKAKIFVPDDFFISGHKIKEYMEKASHGLSKHNLISPHYLIQGLLVGAPTVSVPKFPIYSYYKTRPNTSQRFMGAPITGFHSTSDYSFSRPLEDIWEFYQQNRQHTDIQMTHPLFNGIVRPYEVNPSFKRPEDVTYSDSTLQRRWEKMWSWYGREPIHLQ